MNENILVGLLVVVSVSLIVGPIVWMRPSPRQRQLARLRSYALSLGMRPEQMPVPKALQHYGYPSTLLKYRMQGHGVRWPEEGASWLAFTVPGEAAGGLRWYTGDVYQRGPESLLEGVTNTSLPKGLCAIEADINGVGIYWHEAGDTGQVDELRRLIAPWLEAYLKIFSA